MGHLGHSWVIRSVVGTKIWRVDLPLEMRLGGSPWTMTEFKRPAIYVPLRRPVVIDSLSDQIKMLAGYKLLHDPVLEYIQYRPGSMCVTVTDTSKIRKKHRYQGLEDIICPAKTPCGITSAYIGERCCLHELNCVVIWKRYGCRYRIWCVLIHQKDPYMCLSIHGSIKRMDASQAPPSSAKLAESPLIPTTDKITKECPR